MSKSKKSKATKLEVTVTLTFKEDQIRSLCYDIHSGNTRLGKILLAKLKADPKYFGEFAQALQDTSDTFVDEILDTSPDACANDWLSEFEVVDDEEDEE